MPDVPTRPYPIPHAHIDTVYTTYRINDVDYRRTGYYGCQLESIERKAPPRDTRYTRYILGWEFEVFTAERVGLFKWRITWSLLEVHRQPVRQAGALIESFYSDLREAG
jgi:hypothetical protein